MDEQERLKQRVANLEGALKTLGIIAYLAVLGLAGFLGVQFAPEPSPRFPNPGFDQAGVIQQIIVIAAGLGWVGAVFDVPEALDREVLYWGVLIAMTAFGLGIFTA